MSRSRGWTVCAALFAVACSSAVVGPTDVAGEWRLRSIQQAERSATTVDAPARFTASFGTDGRLSVRADCNSCGGSYRLEDGTLSTGPLACTRAFCVATAPLDTVFVTLLDGDSTVRVSGDRLTVTSARGTLVFTR